MYSNALQNIFRRVANTIKVSWQRSEIDTIKYHA